MQRLHKKISRIKVCLPGRKTRTYTGTVYEKKNVKNHYFFGMQAPSESMTEQKEPVVTFDLVTTPTGWYVIRVDRAMPAVQRIDELDASYQEFFEWFTARYGK